MSTPLFVCHLGQIAYEEAFDLQVQLVQQLAESDSMREGYLLLLEHPPTFTVGRSGSGDNVLASAEELERRGARLLRVNRGGDVTFHGPGQVVAYPIVRLERQARDVHRYLRLLEEVVIRTLSRFGVHAHREPAYTGAWVGDEKIAAIGVAVRRWITYHGVSINVATDLSYFDMIHPCGILDRGVTSLAKVMGCRAVEPIGPGEVARAFAEEFAETFGMTLARARVEDLVPHVPA